MYIHITLARVMHNGLFIPSINTSNFGNKSLRFSAPMSWNNFIKSYPDILNFKHKSQLKFDLKKIYNSKYISVYSNTFSYIIICHPFCVLLLLLLLLFIIIIIIVIIVIDAYYLLLLLLLLLLLSINWYFSYMILILHIENSWF